MLKTGDSGVREMKKIKVITLFTGIGAQEAALKRLGIDYEIVGISEIDKYAIQSYEAINGSTYNYGDITKINALDYADLWTYSSPCQDFSTAGKQQGVRNSDGSLTRSGLLLHVERLLVDSVIRGDNPKYLLMENVKGLVSKKFKPDFDRWLERLEQLGYNNYWQVLNAKDYGVPQNRERVFVVSIRRDVDTKGYKFPEKIALTRKLKDVLESVVDEKYYLSQDKVDKLVLNMDKEISNTIRCGGGGSLDGKHTWDIVSVQHVGNINGRDSHGGFAGDIFNPEGLSPTLNTMQGGNRMPYICASRGRNPENPSDRTTGAPTEQRLEINQTGCSNTLTTVQKDNYVIEPKVINSLKGKTPYGWHFEQGVYDENGLTRAVKAGGGSGNIPKVVQVGNTVEQYRIRKLTPRECWRLMGFTDVEFDCAQMSGISNTQLYKQAGNSIVVDVLAGIFKELLS